MEKEKLYINKIWYGSLLVFGSLFLLLLPTTTKADTDTIISQTQSSAAYCPIQSSSQWAYEYVKNSVPNDFFISDIDLRFRVATNPSGIPFEDKFKIEIWDLDFAHLYAETSFDPNDLTTSQATYNYLFNGEYVNKDFIIKIINTDPNEKNYLFWHRQNFGTDNISGSEAHCVSPSYSGPYDYVFTVRGRYIKFQSWFGIPIAKAECQFVTTGATTTTNCDEATTTVIINDDSTRNIFYGIVLILAVIYFVLWFMSHHDKGRG